MGLVIKVTVGAEWVNDFHEDYCTQTDLPTPDDRAYGFCDEMKKKGHSCLFNWGNDNAWETDFRHPDYKGDSLNWTDNVNFCYYADHGGNWGNVMHIAFSNPHTKCLGASDEWKLGVKNLKWLVLDCCQGVPDLGHIIEVWAKSAKGIHLIFCFIGNKGGVASVGRDFGRQAARGDALCYAWVHSANPAGRPIAIAFGHDSTEAYNRLFNESIHWRDWDQQSLGYMAWMWID